jgi:hypothetical protein
MFKLLCLFISLPLFASTSISLKEIVNKSQQSQNFLLPLQSSVEQSEYAIQASGKLSNPFLTSQIGTLKSAGTSGSTLEFSVVQFVPLNSKLSDKKSVAQLQKDLSSLSLDEKKLWLYHQSFLNGVNLAISEIFKGHTANRQRRYSKIKSYLQNRPLLSPELKASALIIENEIKLLQRNIDEHLLDFELYSKSLCLLLSEDNCAQYHAPNIVMNWSQWDQNQSKQTFDVRRNQEWKILNLEKEISIKEANIISKQRLPELQIGGGYRIEQVVPSNQFQYGIIGFSIPLFDTGSSAYQTASANIRTKKAFLTQKEKEIENDLLKLQEIIKNKFNQMKHFPLPLEARIEKELDELEYEFNRGRINVATFLATDQKLHDSLDLIYAIRFEYLKTLSDWYYLQGQEIPFN